MAKLECSSGFAVAALAGAARYMLLGGMDHVTLKRHLDAAERRTAQGERHLERQRATIARLRDNGLDCRKAEALLIEFEQAQTLHRVDLDRLRERLAAAP